MGRVTAPFIDSHACAPTLEHHDTAEGEGKVIFTARIPRGKRRRRDAEGRVALWRRGRLAQAAADNRQPTSRRGP